MDEVIEGSPIKVNADLVATYCEQNASRIPVRQNVDGVVDTYLLSELPRGAGKEMGLSNSRRKGDTLCFCRTCMIIHPHKGIFSQL